MPSNPISGVAAIASIGPTEAKVTPIITGSRMPTPGKPMHCTSVAMPQANRSALIRKAISSGGSLSARPMISGTATAPAYITSTCCKCQRHEPRKREFFVDGMDGRRSGHGSGAPQIEWVKSVDRPERPHVDVRSAACDPRACLRISVLCAAA